MTVRNMNEQYSSWVLYAKSPKKLDHLVMPFFQRYFTVRIAKYLTPKESKKTLIKC